MSIIKKQLLAIKKVARKNYAQAPAYFDTLILEIDLKLKEIEDDELMDALAELETIDLGEIA